MSDNNIPTGQVQEPAQPTPLMDAYVQFFAQAVSQVKECRHLTSSTQDELAKAIGVDRRKIIAIENGEMDIETLIKICDYYDINFTFVIG